VRAAYRTAISAAQILVYCTSSDERYFWSSEQSFICRNSLISSILCVESHRLWEIRECASREYLHDSRVSTSLCGRDGRTICGPLRVPKSTYVTLAHKRKPKFFYFGCSLVRRFYCKKSKQKQSRGGRTDEQTDRVRRNMRPPPREEGRIITYSGVTVSPDLHWETRNCYLYCSHTVTRALTCVRRNIYRCTPEAKELAYTCLVHPLMEFAAPA